MKVFSGKSISTPTYISWLVASFVVTVVVTYVVACLFQSWFAIQALKAVGAEFTFNAWLRTIGHDLYGLAFNGKYISYSQMIAIGFLIALPTAALCNKLLPLPPALIYSVAGATAMATILYNVQEFFFDLVLFSGTRGLAGWSAQLVAGALGGLVFSYLITLRLPLVRRGYHD